MCVTKSAIFAPVILKATQNITSINMILQLNAYQDNAHWSKILSLLDT